MIILNKHPKYKVTEEENLNIKGKWSKKKKSAEVFLIGLLFF